MTARMTVCNVNGSILSQPSVETYLSKATFSFHNCPLQFPFCFSHFQSLYPVTTTTSRSHFLDPTPAPTVIFGPIPATNYTQLCVRLSLLVFAYRISASLLRSHTKWTRHVMARPYIIYYAVIWFVISGHIIPWQSCRYASMCRRICPPSLVPCGPPNVFFVFWLGGQLDLSLSGATRCWVSAAAA